MKMVKVSNWDKFVLLLWKNWTLQWSHKIQLLVELLLPAVFSLLMVLVRTIVVPELTPLTTYPELQIDNLTLLKKYLANARRLQTLLKIFFPKASSTLSPKSSKYPNWTIAYTPSNSILETIVANAAKSLDCTYVSAENSDDLVSQVTNNNYFAGIEFDESLINLSNTSDFKQFHYALRFPSELRTSTSQLQVTWSTNKLFPAYDVTGPRNRDAADGGLPVGYLREGFLPLQHAITTAFLKLVAGVDELPTVAMQRYPYPEYIYDPLLEGLAGIMALIVLLSFIYPSTCITRYITTEKEKQLKEVMKIMGLANWLHWTAWFVKSFCMFGISALLISIFMKIKWIDNVSVLTYADWSVLFVFLLIYVITTICFCFMLATFFSKASTAAAVTGLVMFIAFVPFSFLGNSYDELTLSTKLGWCLILNTAMGFGFKVITDFEGTGEGIQWTNLFTPVSVDDDLTLGAIIFVMLASCVLYMLICLYIEQIFPGDFGVPKKWNFPLTRKFWFGDSEYIGVEDIVANGDLQNHSPDAFEVEPIGKHVGVQVRNLKKKFGDKMVVKGVSINMYEDEITVLLGHNGAGKTTTISMLTGMFPPTAGTAIINGSDIRTNIEGARMSLGICPQHNVLFDDMTVANHLVFFSRLKGLKGAAIKREVDKYLRMIQLENKANVISSKLSGGMKRKLSVCCALTGDTKVVLCDEPSSGLDPAARRQLWDLLQAEKTGRTLLLTTHFMDEADVLGDRIAIMCDGELKCHGTSFFLKKKYGSGYHLICVKRDNCNSEDVTELLRKYIPNISPESEIGAELSYQLPDNYSYAFEKMFGSLEENSTNLNLNGYGIGITSLEEVFMKVGSENAGDGTRKSQSVVMNGGTGFAEDDVESVQSDNIFSESTRLLKGSNLFMNQWQAMILKKLLYTWRNKLLFFIQNIMPIFFVIVTILVARNQGGFNTLQPLTISLEQYPQIVTLLTINSTVEPNSLEYKIAKQYETIATSYGVDHAFQTTGDQSFTDYILELGRTLQVRINSRYIAAATIGTGHITAWLNNQPLHTAPLTVNMIYNAMAKVLIDPDAEIVVTNAPLPYTIKTLQAQLDTGNNLGTQLATNLCFCMCFVSAFYILFLIKERESRSKLLQFVGGVRVWTFWLTQLLWDMLTYTLTALIVIITLICFQESGFSTFFELGRYFLLMFIFGFSVLPFTYLASFLFAEPAVGFGRISIINIFLGLALFIVIMVMSFPFYDTKATADALQWFFRVFPHFSLAMGLNKLYTNTATQNICSKALEEMPEYVLCGFWPQCCEPTSYFGWTDPGILPEVLYLCATALVFFFILILREYGFINELIYYIRKKTFKPPPPPEDGYFEEDVQSERERIVAMSQNELAGQNLVLDRVTKYYNKFIAVNQISLGVKQTECFGLLGVNGAGKTTTFKMLTGDERITFGTACVKGMSLSSEMNNIYKDIGYCPQFDALLDDLTGREMLRIFCLLRGVNKMRINAISEELAKSFGFMKHIDKPTKAYSGGNKRKLSAAIAVIGNPSVIYLDEPTTGIDPAARRQLWNMLCRIRDSGKSIVLTSHSMEECEALCTRLAVMVNGEFKCIGSTQHLKNKFSKGLILKIKVRRNLDLVKQSRNSLSLKDDERSVPTQLLERDITAIKEFVDKEFPQAILQEEYQGILTFYIPLSGIKWSTIFGLLERNRDELNIEDYSISQTTLEEIFLEFAKYQREDARLFNADDGCCGCFKRRQALYTNDGVQITSL